MRAQLRHLGMLDQFRIDRVMNPMSDFTIHGHDLLVVLQDTLDDGAQEFDGADPVLLELADPDHVDPALIPDPHRVPGGIAEHLRQDHIDGAVLNHVIGVEAPLDDVQHDILVLVQHDIRIAQFVDGEMHRNLQVSQSSIHFGFLLHCKAL